MKFLTEFLLKFSVPTVILGSPSRDQMAGPSSQSCSGHFQSSKKAPSCDVNQTWKVDKSNLAQIL